MSAISELFPYFIYISIICVGIFFFIFFLKLKNSFRYVFLILSLSFFVSIYYIEKNGKENFKNWELENAGTYELENYNDKKDCLLILEKSNSFLVKQKDSILETGNWHFEVGGDYFIVYLNDKKDQLGSGRFEYSKKIN